MVSIEQAILNLAVALGLSAAIGFERQWRNRLAGLRTNTLVALGAGDSPSRPGREDGTATT